MNLLEFLSNSDWDAPFYKLLAHNDTGEARGHQGGMVFPTELRVYLPQLTVTADATVPDRHLWAEMYIGATFIAADYVRYQLQTWSRTRTPESRITDGLKPLRQLARKDDVLLFQRRSDSVDHFRLILVKGNTPEYAEIEDSVASSGRWGVLLDRAPVTQRDLADAEAEIKSLVAQPFQLQVSEIARNVTSTNRIARSTVFSERVRSAYQYKCSVSGFQIVTPGPARLHEVQAAHVVPLNERGSDDIRNGLSLTHTLHWAFDRGLFGISAENKVVIPKQVHHSPGNDFIKRFENALIQAPADPSLRVDPSAFDWHLKNVVSKWE